MPASEKLLLAVQRCCFISKRGVRDRFRPSQVALTGAGKTFEDRLKELTLSSETATDRPNIGLAPSRIVQEKKEASTKWTFANRKNPNRRAVLDEIASDWISDNAPVELVKIVDHYNVFQHLFGDAFFYPQFDWQITYSSEDAKNQKSTAVGFGNKIQASACLSQPNVEFKLPLSADSSHWCLVMTALDGNLLSNNEYVMWMAANLPGGVKDPLSKADIVVPYIPPVPPHGFGYCRVAFVLYKQLGGRINKQQEQLLTSKIANDLQSRDFSTLQWYGKRQELLTPASLRFFQTAWDDSVTDTYHDVFNMKEPRYEYSTPEPYRTEQLVRPPEDVPFNEYLDRYRDRKDIAEEVFRYYLYSSPSPLGPRQPPSKYPNLKRVDPRKAVSWIRDEEKNKNLRQGKWKNLPPPL